MKTFKLFLIAILLCTISASSQITKGNWMVGGSGSFTSYKAQFKIILRQELLPVITLIYRQM